MVMCCALCRAHCAWDRTRKSTTPPIRDIEFDGKNYWMASNKGLVKKDGVTISAVFFREGLFANVIRDIALEGKTLWIATRFGLVRYEP